MPGQRLESMNWEKLGRVFEPEIFSEFGLTAALMPIVRVLDPARGLIRLYFSPRDDRGRSQVRYIELAVSNPDRILNFSERPLLLPGKLGSFDDAGITLGSIVEDGERRLLFYTGWSLTQSVPFNNSIGVSVLGDDDYMHRLGDGPVMTRTLTEPYSCASPFVLKEDGVFKMWYASMDLWEEHLAGPRHFYNIKFAKSLDGIHWDRPGTIAIDYEKTDEYAFGRPFVLREDGIHKMWYSYRGASYKIGYAESPNGESWVRKDDLAGIEVSATGWDSEMVEYPYLFDCDDGRYMAYNGNGFGKSGIGLARLSS